MDTSFTNSRESVSQARQDSTDWSTLALADQVRSLELEGYLLVPNLLEPNLLESVRAEVDKLPTTAVDYSEHQRGFSDLQWTNSPQTIQLVGLPAMAKLLGSLFGDAIICTSCHYSLSEPGHPGIAIHTDSQPYGSKIFGLQASSPCLVRVLYYLDDLTRECAPFKVIPRSHLSLHQNANPYRRYLSHPEEVMVTCQAGSAVVINQKVFHGNFPNYSDHPRRMLAIAYRPVWAGPIGEVTDYDPKQVASLPPDIQNYFGSLNSREIEFDLPNRPDGMARNAAGLGPSRWKT
jgi:hypothetical protein